MKQKIKNFFTLNRRSNGGFTLVELVVVIAILAILAGAAVPAYSGYINKANEAADQQLLAALNTAYASACAAEGESHIGRGDVPVSITLEAISGGYKVPAGLIGNPAINDNFELFFPDGQFKQFDKLLFVSSLGVFTENTAAALIQIVKDAWNASSFGKAGDGGKAVLEELSKTFNVFSEYFSGNHSAFPDGFSMDGVIATLPEDVQNAFGFGSYDITPDQQEALLNEYVEGYAGWSNEKKAQWKENNKETVNNIKGNAYVMNIANAAGSGVTAEGIKNDISELMAALNNPDNYSGEKFEALKESCRETDLEMYGLTAEMLAAVGASGVKNDSGISTLGSMYALAAGYLNSDEYKKSGDTTLRTDISDFNNVLAAMNHSGFNSYLAEGNAENDIEAYLNYMQYVSENGVNMGVGGAFSALGNAAWEIIGGTN